MADNGAPGSEDSDTSGVDEYIRVYFEGEMAGNQASMDNEIVRWGWG